MNHQPSSMNHQPKSVLRSSDHAIKRAPKRISLYDI
jgi:hypothetical protein